MRRIRVLALLFVAAFCMAVTPVTAHDIEVVYSGQTIYYNFINDNTELEVSYRGTSSSYSNEYTGNVIIPITVNFNGKKYPVTRIGEDAFSNCSGLTAVTIPNSVTSIGGYAFYNCSGLTSVTIPNSVTSIGWSAFENCSNLTSVTIPNSVTSIGWSAFENCSSLTSITIPNSVTSIEWETFQGCIGLTSATIGNSVTSIGEYAFSNCSGLASITIPNSVTSIKEFAFSLCSRLTSVTIGSGVTYIERGAFYGCSGLTSISIDANNTIYDSRNNCNAIITTSSNALIQGCANTIIPNSVTSIGSDAFYGCSGLTSIMIPNSVTSIGELAFSFCSSLTSISIDANNTIYDSRNNCNAIIKTSTNELIVGCTNTIIPNSVTSIGGTAFYGCSSLTSITIPNSVTSIGGYAFAGCSSLTSVTIPNSVTSIGGGAFQGCSGLTSVTIPNSVTSIGGGAFQGCSGLTSITIPNSVTSIGGRAFRNCSNLTEMYCYAKQVPTTGSSVFYEVDLTNATLHVPASALNDYKTTAPWSEFGIIVPIDEEEVDDLQDYLNSFADTEDVLTATTYTRQFKNTQWQSLYVPFSLSYDQWSPYVEVARLTGASTTDDHAQIEATLLTAGDGDLLANTPYLIRAKKTGKHTISFGASQLSEQQENTQALGELLIIKGINSQRTGLKSSGFRCMIGGSLCYPSTDDYVLPPFRWYAYPDGPRIVPNSPVLVVIHDGTTTGITAKADAGDKDDRHAIYDLSGRRLTAGHPSELPEGIYLIDGKKCFVK